VGFHHIIPQWSYIGQVRPGSDSLSTGASPSTPSTLPRKVDSRSWYEAVHRKRLSYGPHFTSLEEITSSAATPSKASAKLRNNWHGDEANYHLHPVIVDAFFQLLSLAARNGLGHAYRRLVPTSIDHLTISRCRSDELQLCLAGGLTQDGGASGQGQCIAGSRIVSQFSGLRMSLFEGAESTAKNDFPLTARAEWVSHVRFRDISTLFQPVDANASDIQILEDLTHSAIRFSQQVSLGVKPRSPHLQRYEAWLEEQRVASSERMHGTELAESIKSMAQSLDSSSLSYAAKAIAKICSNVDSILSGKRDAYDVLATDGILEKLLEFTSEYDGSKFFRDLGHFKPNLRVLKLGAGSGAGTTKILQCLRHNKGQNLFSRYVLADASTGLIDVAKARFKRFTNLEFACLNIERDLGDQGFDDEEFDLIIAAGVLHTTTNVARSLSNIRKLLSPKGRLLVQEPASGLLWTKFILGTLPSWWSGHDDSRPDEPLMSRERWTEKLDSAGFSCPNFVHGNIPANLHQSTIMVVQPERQQSLSRKVTLLCEQSTPETEKVCHELQARGYDIDRCTLNERTPDHWTGHHRTHRPR
jgi:SAM-dependent methyltransferase